jgi:hypothetical protein
VEVGDHEIGVMNMNVKRHLRKRYTSNPTQHKVDNKTAREKNSAIKTDFSSPQSG